MIFNYIFNKNLVTDNDKIILINNLKDYFSKN